MGVFAAGQVVLLSFPFSDLSRNKLRPGVILARAGDEDWIVCQVTSNPHADALSFQLLREDFESGALPHTSYARPRKLFTSHASLIASTVGTLKTDSFAGLRNAVIEVIRSTETP